ncbi:hypothetical protein Tco_1034754, partial [Tanacetum coccineum]
ALNSQHGGITAVVTWGGGGVGGDDVDGVDVVAVA